MAYFIKFIVLALVAGLMVSSVNWFMRRINSIATSLDRIANRLDSMDETRRDDPARRF